jgi:hypothetical protein
MWAKGAGVGAIINNAGLTTTSTHAAWSPCAKAIVWPVNLREEPTTNWRAGCGKPASPVREEGRFYPVPTSFVYMIVAPPPGQYRRLPANTTRFGAMF